MGEKKVILKRWKIEKTRGDRNENIKKNDFFLEPPNWSKKLCIKLILSIIIYTFMK